MPTEFDFTALSTDAFRRMRASGRPLAIIAAGAIAACTVIGSALSKGDNDTIPSTTVVSSTSETPTCAQQGWPYYDRLCNGHSHISDRPVRLISLDRDAPKNAYTPAVRSSLAAEPAVSRGSVPSAVPARAVERNPRAAKSASQNRKSHAKPVRIAPAERIARTEPPRQHPLALLNGFWAR